MLDVSRPRLRAGLAPDAPPSAEIMARTKKAACSAVHAGDFAPTFRLRDLNDHVVSLLDLLQPGPVVVCFHRGIWCRFCETALSAMAAIDGEIRALGASQVVIGPPPGKGPEALQAAALPMTVATDHGLRVALTYGLTIEVPDEARDAYAQAGYLPPKTSADAPWLVPIPATYLILQTGRIALAAIDADYRNRFQPSEVLSILRSLA